PCRPAGHSDSRPQDAVDRERVRALPEYPASLRSPGHPCLSPFWQTGVPGWSTYRAEIGSWWGPAACLEETANVRTSENGKDSAKGRIMPRLTLIDNYDSFTFNVLHALGRLGAEVAVVRNDKTTVDEVLAAKPDAIVISPGPCTPRDAGISCALIEKAGTSVPILGICLGMQAMGDVYGGEVVRAPVPVHGKVNTITHTGTSVFRGINEPIQATRYHSLVVDRGTLPAELD